MRSDRPGAVIGSIGTFRTARRQQGCAAKARPDRDAHLTDRLVRAGSLRTDRVAPRGPGESRRDQPELVTLAYRIQDDAWHFAYAVQSWAAEQSGHVVMIPYALYDRPLTERSSATSSVTSPCERCAASRGRSKPGHRAQAPLDNARPRRGTTTTDIEFDAFLDETRAVQGTNSIRCLVPRRGVRCPEVLEHDDLVWIVRVNAAPALAGGCD